MRLRFSGFLLIFSFLTVSALLSPAYAEGVKSFKPEAHFATPGGEEPEIVASTPDGNFLYYTSAPAKKIGVLDISEPSKPVPAKSLATGEAEPTSLAVSRDGKYLVVVMRNGDALNKPVPSTLSLYGLKDKSSPEHIGDVSLGIGSDSVALAENDGRLIAVVAIEDEENDDSGEAALDGKRPGRVDVVVLNTNSPEKSILNSVEFPKALLEGVKGVNFTSDPQPEFVAVHPNQKEFAVTLQENNAVAVVDIADPEKPVIKTIFCAGTVERKADVKKDGKIDFSDSFNGRRESDGIAYITAGDEVCLALANEGDTDVKTFGDKVFSGGRGVSLHKMDGSVLWDSGLELEQRAALLGYYPDHRSNKRSIEAEGVTGARFYGDDLLITVSERGSFIAVYRVPASFQPELIGLLPAGISPEGIIAIDGRSDSKKLIVSANEVAGTINIYSVSEGEQVYSPDEPLIYSETIPWCAISGFSTDGTDIYAVPDDACQPSVIWTLSMADINNGKVKVAAETVITKDGKPVNYDLEGVCWTKEGFWLVSEGKKGEENVLIFAAHDGTVKAEYSLPAELISKHGEPDKFGFEGVAATSDGKSVYVAMQRGFDSSKPMSAILRFDTASLKWETAWYPLEQHSKDPKKFWMGLSDLALAGDNKLLVIERDKGMGGTSEVKRIYAVDVSSFKDGMKLEKKLVSDVLKEKNMLLEKLESLCVLGESLWVATDNDGAGWTQMLRIKPAF